MPPREASWSGAPSIRGSTEAFRMILLTFSMIGISFTWGVEMTYGTPYLLSLGLSKSKTSAVWVAGPLSGILVQPIIGAIADRSTSKFGRRRPFMLVGSLFVTFCLFTLAWASEIVRLVVKDDEKARFGAIVLAVIMIYLLDFSINAVQASGRSLIVDTLPIAKQQAGSAWASRLSNIGNLIGYAIGTINLPGFWGKWLGASQFKQLCVIASVILTGCCLLTAWATKERVLVTPADTGKGNGLFQSLSHLFKTTIGLPKRMQAICWAMFWAWIGWFTFLFYSANWVGETYFRYTSPEALGESSDKLGEIGRIGSLSLVIFSLISFAASVFLPFVVQSPDKKDRRDFDAGKVPKIVASCVQFLRKQKPQLLTIWFASHLLFAVAQLCAPFVRSVGFATVIVATAGIPWALAMWAPFAFMGVEINRLASPNYRVEDGNIVMTSTGGAYQRAKNEEPDAEMQEHDGDDIHERQHLNTEKPFDLEDIDDLMEDLEELHLNHNMPTRSPKVTDDDDLELAEGELLGQVEADLDDASTGETAGVYMGILNLYAAAPQLLGTVINMIVFAIVEPGRNPELANDIGKSVPTGTGNGTNLVVFSNHTSVNLPVLQSRINNLWYRDEPSKPPIVNAIAVCMFIGGLSSLAAAYATWRLRHVQ